MRLFLAVLPDAAAAEALARARGILIEILAGATSLRWVPDDQLHVTLHFLGDVDRVVFDRLEHALGDVVHVPSATIVLTSAVWMPFPRRPRLLALAGEASGGIIEVHREVGERIRRAGVAIEAQPFRPHLTLARIRQHGRTSRAPLPDPAAIVVPTVHWVVESVVLIESDLSGPSPRYTPRSRIRVAA